LPAPSTPDLFGESVTVAQLAAAQHAAGRPLRFDEYLAIVLYGEHGFYRRRAGRPAQDLSPPEVGPLFAAVLARWIDAEHARLGAPDDFTIVEVGAGPGTLARAILLAAPHWIERYVAVEISPTQRAQHPAGVRSQAELPSVPFRGVVIANELLDNLPFRLAVFDGGWREAMVSIARDGTPSELLVAAPPEWSWLPADAAHGARLPAQHAAGAWVRDVRSLLIDGTVLAFDYCTARTADLALVPWRQWLRYRGPRHTRRGPAGHHRAGVPRSAPCDQGGAHAGSVPAAVGHRGTVGGGPHCVGGGSGRAGPRRTADAQPRA
jgi:SAM-dependent MidA family methyltransferase